MREIYYSIAGFQLPDTKNLCQPGTPFMKVKDSIHHLAKD